MCLGLFYSEIVLFYVFFFLSICSGCRSVKNFCVQSLSCIQLFAAPWTVALLAPLSLKFSRQEHWSGVPFPIPRDLPSQGSNPSLLHWQMDSLPLVPSGSPILKEYKLNTDREVKILSLITGVRWTGKPGVLQSMGSQSQTQLSDRTELSV